MYFFSIWYLVYFLILKSELFHMGVNLFGVRGCPVIWLNFHQAVRVAASFFEAILLYSEDGLQGGRV